MESTADRKKRVRRIIAAMRKEYPDARCRLEYSNPIELLVATILSAQCTDERVNKTTPEVFEKYRTAGDYAKARTATLEKLFRPCGFFRNKAKSVNAACSALVEKHNGELPADVKAMSKLPGVGRKTANVVLGNALGIPGVAVDTHVIRLCGRLELASAKNVEKKYADKIELELMEIVPKKDWTMFAHLLGAHGRAVCPARKPKCLWCRIRRYCPYGNRGR